MSEQRWHLGHLDSLRGIAVLGVVLVHSVYGPAGILQIGERGQEVAFLGQRGVQLFFVVSAFTLFLSAQNRREETSPNLNFFIRRFFRLAPMFYLATLGTCIVWPMYAGSARDIALSLAFLHGLSPTAIISGARGGWSVADEALFYLLMPLLLRWIRSIKTAGLWLIVASACSEGLVHTLNHFDPSHQGFYQFSSFIAEFPVFLCGIVAFFIWRDHVPRHTKAMQGNDVFPVLLFCLVAVFFITLPSQDGKVIGTSILLAALVLLLSLCPHPWLVNTPTRFLGKISYSIYLLHFYPMDYLWAVKPERFAACGKLAPVAMAAVHFFGALALTVPVAFLTWRFIEEPGIRLGRRLIDLLEHRSAGKRLPLVPPVLAATQAGNSPDAQF